MLCKLGTASTFLELAEHFDCQEMDKKKMLAHIDIGCGWMLIKTFLAKNWHPADVGY